MPELAAVELAEHALTLHLSTPATLGPPWVASGDRLHWTLSAGTDLREVGDLAPDQPAPYPLLVTIGAGDDGHVWLLNIEDLDLSITGDTTFGRDFAVASTLYERPSAPGKIGRQMQTWVKFDDGWRVVAAHVSLIDVAK